MDATLTTAALAGAEKLIAKALEYDPASRFALAALAPQVLAVKLTAPQCTIFVAPCNEGVRLLGYYEAEATTEIQGSLAALLSLAKSERLNLKDSGVQIKGSTSFLAELQNILKNLDIDWEEILSHMFGDIAGHQSAGFIRNNMSWAKDRAQNIQRLTSEFITEELRLLPSKPELEFFYEQVDELAIGVDRIEARIQQVMEKFLGR